MYYSGNSHANDHLEHIVHLVVNYNGLVIQINEKLWKAEIVDSYRQSLLGYFP